MNHDSLFFTLASLLYLSMALSSTSPKLYKSEPDIVLFPESTCPTKTIETGT